MDVHQQVKQVWGRIAHWFQTHAPRALQHLYGPVTAQELAAAAAEIGMPFPAAVQALYQIHNGEDGTTDIFPDRYRLLPVAECVQHWSWQTALVRPRDHDLSEHMVAWHDWVASGSCVIDGPVKPLAGSARWLPVLATPDGGSTLFLDFDPAPGGQLGQVIEVDLEGSSWRVHASSFLTFLHTYADRLEQGRYRVTECGMEDRQRTDRPPITPTMPDYLCDVVIETYDEALAGLHPIDRANGNTDVILYGAMGLLMGTYHDALFSLHIPGYEEQRIVATPELTYGYSAIRVRQYARVRVTPYSGQCAVPAMDLSDPPVVSWVALTYTKLQ